MPELENSFPEQPEHITPPPAGTSFLVKLKTKWPVVLGALGSLAIFTAIIYVAYSYSKREQEVQLMPTITPVATTVLTVTPLPQLSPTKIAAPTPDIVVTKHPTVTQSPTYSPLITQEPLQDQVCVIHNYKMAFILVGREESEFTQERLNTINRIKASFPTYFLKATQGLAKVDTTYPVHMLINDGNIVYYDYHKDCYAVNIPLATKKFYETNKDQFHFLSFYTAFKAPAYQYHKIVKNNIANIGLETKNDTDYTDYYGSVGELLGVNHMGSIDQYEDFTSGSEPPGLLHETGHQWCCGLGDDFDPQNISKLPILQQQRLHLYRGLASPYPEGCPMGADYWVPNEDGTYKRDTSRYDAGQIYHPFLLYFMGLLNPEDIVAQNFPIYNAGTPQDSFNFETATYTTEVNIQDVIDFVGGIRYCAQ